MYSLPMGDRRLSSDAGSTQSIVDVVNAANAGFCFSTCATLGPEYSEFVGGQHGSAFEGGWPPIRAHRKGDASEPPDPHGNHAVLPQSAFCRAMHAQANTAALYSGEGGKAPHQQSGAFPRVDSIDVLFGAAREDVYDEDDYKYEMDDCSQYLDAGSDEEVGPGYTDEDMAAPTTYGAIGEPYIGIAGYTDAPTAAGLPNPATSAAQHFGGRELPACFAMEADCRAAWAALQPTLQLERPLHGAQAAQPLSGAHNSSSMAAGMGRRACFSTDCGGGDFQFARVGTRSVSTGLGFQTSYGSGYGGEGQSEHRYVPQSPERRRKPWRKWDVAVNYERITRRLEPLFDAVASEAPTTPPGRHPSQRPSSRSLNFGGGNCSTASQQLPSMPSPGGPPHLRNQSFAMHTTPQHSARREMFPPLGSTANVPRPMSGVTRPTSDSLGREGTEPMHPSLRPSSSGRAAQKRGSSLHCALHALGGAVDEDAMRHVIIGCALGLEALHAEGWLHRDLSLLSVELDDLTAFDSVRLRAGALAVEAGYDGRFSEARPQPVGQPAFLAPEVVRCTRGRVSYSAAGDMWGLGVVLLMLLNGGRHPFGSGGPAAPAMSCDDLQSQLDLHLVRHLQEVSNDLAGSSSWVGSESGGSGGDYRQPGTCVLPLLAVQLVRALLRADPGQRLTAAAVLSHPWIVASQSQRFRRAASASALRLASKPDPEPYSLTLEGSAMQGRSVASQRPWARASTPGSSHGEGVGLTDDHILQGLGRISSSSTVASTDRCATVEGGVSGEFSFYSASTQLPRGAIALPSYEVLGLRPSSATPLPSYRTLDPGRTPLSYRHSNQRPHSATVAELGHYSVPVTALPPQYQMDQGSTQGSDLQWHVGQGQDLGHRLQQHNAAARARFETQQERNAEPWAGLRSSIDSRQGFTYSEGPRVRTVEEPSDPLQEGGPGVLSWLHRLVTGQPIDTAHHSDYTASQH